MLERPLQRGKPSWNPVKAGVNFYRALPPLYSQQQRAFPKLSQAQTFFFPSDEDAYWAVVRSQFSFSESAVPMNAANLCPSFRSVAETVTALTYDIDRDCSFNNRAKFGGLLEQSRATIAQQINFFSR
ncbi:MAG: hypothetical protein Ct9H300mP22_4690 [Gammaproteobacteria bacterium]|nr:MAG: hypothetical protein Ct9H300mP22_4690 [Gammaproteobacteria bacterium]